MDVSFLNKMSLMLEGKNNLSDLVEAQKVLCCKFPPFYIEIMQQCDGCMGYVGHYYIEFWGLTDVINLNVNYADFDLNNYVVFASDGGGMMYAFSKANAEIFKIPSDSIDDESAKKCSDNLEQLIYEMDSGTATSEY